MFNGTPTQNFPVKTVPSKNNNTLTREMKGEIDRENRVVKSFFISGIFLLYFRYILTLFPVYSYFISGISAGCFPVHDIAEDSLGLVVHGPPTFRHPGSDPSWAPNLRWTDHGSSSKICQQPIIHRYDL